MSTTQPLEAPILPGMPDVAGAGGAMVLHPARLGPGNGAVALGLAPDREITVGQSQDPRRGFELRWLDELTAGLCVARLGRGGSLNLARDLAAIHGLVLMIPTDQVEAGIAVDSTIPAPPSWPSDG